MFVHVYVCVCVCEYRSSTVFYGVRGTSGIDLEMLVDWFKYSDLSRVFYWCVGNSTLSCTTNHTHFRILGA